MPATTIMPMLSERTRAIIYAVYALGSLALGAVQVGFATAEMSQPVWLSVTLAVWVFLGSGFGLTALSHTPAQPRRAQESGVDHV